jgi:ketosteroid isomerase-like protein
MHKSELDTMNLSISKPEEIMTTNSQEAERAAIQKVIHDSIGWAQTKDLKRLFSIMAQDDDFFIFHPDSKSTVSGFETFKGMSDFWMNPDFKATDFAVKELKITFSQSGTVAWWSAFLDDHAEWKGQPTGWDNARWTGVLEKRDGIWMIVQMHFSFARDD